MKKISLWAVLTNGPKVGCFPVQRRLSTKIGKDGFPEYQSYPGVLQPLVTGKGEPGESPMKILFRETKEEVGEEFAGILSRKTGCGRKFFRFSPEEYRGKNGEPVTDYNFIVRISQEELDKVDKVKLYSGAEPNLVFLSRKDADNIRTTKEINGEIQEDNLVMFPDHLEIFKKIAA
ncbi:MAG: hypothetical protein WC926_03245 [Candidatus Paceibacterota bacterium]|jgi:hypothetical protein